MRPSRGIDHVFVPNGMGGEFCPRVFCEQCGEVIDRDAPGIVTWKVHYKLDPPESDPVHFFHQGDCDRLANERGVVGDVANMWDSVDAWLVHLTNNTHKAIEVRPGVPRGIRFSEALHRADREAYSQWLDDSWAREHPVP